MPSTVIASLDYDPADQSLMIGYVSGQVYRYKEVPETVYKEFNASRVKGRHLRFFIKGKYAAEKIERSTIENIEPE